MFVVGFYILHIVSPSLTHHHPTMFGRSVLETSCTGGLRNLARSRPPYSISRKTALVVTASLGLSFYLVFHWRSTGSDLPLRAEAPDRFDWGKSVVDAEQILNAWTGQPVVVGWLRVTNVTWYGDVLEVEGGDVAGSVRRLATADKLRCQYGMTTRCTSPGSWVTWVTQSCSSDLTLETCSKWRRKTHTLSQLAPGPGSKMTATCGRSTTNAKRSLHIDVFRGHDTLGGLTWTSEVNGRFTLVYFPTCN
jgi:hypothetical protein